MDTNESPIQESVVRKLDRTSIKYLSRFRDKFDESLFCTWTNLVSSTGTPELWTSTSGGGKISISGMIFVAEVSYSMGLFTAHKRIIDYFYKNDTLQGALAH